MPYIEKVLRDYVDKEIDALVSACMDASICTKPEETMAKMLTYTFFKILKRIYASRNWYMQGDVDKILESVKDEFHRRFIHKHEDAAIQRNGDV